MQYSLESVAAIEDPVARYQAAKEASETLAAEWRRIEVGAMRQLWDEFGTPGAAADALGLTRQSVVKALAAGDPAAVPLGTGAAPAEPALNFATAGDAEDALRDLAERQQDIDDQAPSFLLGALAAGVDPVRVSTLTRVRLTDIRRMRPAGNIPVSRLTGAENELLEDFGRLVTKHAAALKDSAVNKEDQGAAFTWWHAAREIVANAAPYLLVPAPTVRVADFEDAESYADALVAEGLRREEEETADDDLPGGREDELAGRNGPDAWLAARCAAYTRYANATGPLASSPAEAEFQQGVRRGFAEVRDAIRHLRSTGTLPVLTTGGQER
ncbi:hypothetical protein ABZ682_19215 [Streptomyces griseoviridis]|uniref:hypothetical protein n=1 Tax=Streptomyces griseoviridis TaxID=45398 RepID=UPI003408586E